MKSDLSPRQQQLYDLLLNQGDVPLKTLYEALKTPASRPYTARWASQWMSKPIALLNRKLARRGLRVVPGALLKHSYRLTITQ